MYFYDTKCTDIDSILEFFILNKSFPALKQVVLENVGTNFDPEIIGTFIQEYEEQIETILIQVDHHGMSYDTKKSDKHKNILKLELNGSVDGSFESYLKMLDNILLVDEIKLSFMCYSKAQYNQFLNKVTTLYKDTLVQIKFDTMRDGDVVMLRETALTNLFTQCKLLTSVSFSECDVNTILEYICTPTLHNQQHVTFLELIRCYNVQTETLKTIINNKDCTLNTLRIFDCSRVDVSSVRKCAAKCIAKGVSNVVIESDRFDFEVELGCV